MSAEVLGSLLRSVEWTGLFGGAANADEWAAGEPAYLGDRVAALPAQYPFAAAPAVPDSTPAPARSSPVAVSADGDWARSCAASPPRIPRLARRCCGGLAAGTTLLMADGRRVPVEAVRCGDRLMSRDPRNGSALGSRVLRTRSFTGRRTLVLELLDGSRLECTPEHPFVEAGGNAVEAAEVESGTLLRACGVDRNVAVVAVESGAGHTVVHEFVLEGAATCFVGRSGIWAGEDARTPGRSHFGSW